MIKNDPEMRINSVISDLRNKVDLRREELKSEIDLEATKMIEKLDEFEKECKSNIPSIKSGARLDNKLERWRNDFTECEKSLSTFKKETWNKVFNKSSYKLRNLQSELLKFNDNLFLNRLNQFKDSISSNYHIIR